MKIENTGFPAGTERTSKTEAERAAGEFEALLLAQMLRTARQSCASAPDGSSDESSDSILEMAEQQIAQSLSAAGGLGLSKLLVRGLEQAASHPR